MKFNKSSEPQEIVERSDRPRPEETQHIDEEDMLSNGLHFFQTFLGFLTMTSSKLKQTPETKTQYGLQSEDDITCF